MQARSNGTKRPAMLDYEADCNKSVSVRFAKAVQVSCAVMFSCRAYFYRPGVCCVRTKPGLSMASAIFYAVYK